MPARAVAAAALLGIALGLPGCRLWAPLWRPPRLPECGGPLLSTRAMGDSFRLRERHRVTGGRVNAALEVVAHKQGPELVVVGFGRFGSKLFSLVQRDTDVQVVSELASVLEVPPRNVLRDLHLEHFLGLPGAPRADGEHAGVVGGAEIREQWRDGVLRQRSWRAASREAVTLRFGVGAETATVWLRDPSCGYRATLVTLPGE